MPSMAKVSMPTGDCFSVFGGMMNRSYLSGLILKFRLSKWVISNLCQSLVSSEVLAPLSLSRAEIRSLLSFSAATVPPCTEQTSASFLVRLSIFWSFFASLISPASTLLSSAASASCTSGSVFRSSAGTAWVKDSLASFRNSQVRAGNFSSSTRSAVSFFKVNKKSSYGFGQTNLSVATFMM